MRNRILSISDIVMPGMGGPGGMKNIPDMQQLKKMQERMKGMVTE